MSFDSIYKSNPLSTFNPFTTTFILFDLFDHRKTLCHPVLVQKIVTALSVQWKRILLLFPVEASQRFDCSSRLLILLLVQVLYFCPFTGPLICVFYCPKDPPPEAWASQGTAMPERPLGFTLFRSWTVLLETLQPPDSQDARKQFAP